MPAPVSLDVPNYVPDDYYAPPKRKRVRMPEFDGAPLRDEPYDDSVLDDFRASHGYAEDYYDEDAPRRNMPPPPPPLRPGEVPRRKRPPAAGNRGRKKVAPPRAKRSVRRNAPRRQNASFQFSFSEIIAPLRRVTRLRPNVNVNTKIVSIFSWCVAGVASIIIGAWFIINMFSYNAFAVYLNGVHMGYIPNTQADLTSAELHDYAVQALQAARAGSMVTVNERVTIEERRVPNSERIQRGDMLQVLSRSFTYEMTALAIYVNGSYEATVRNQAAVDQVLLLLGQNWANENTVRTEVVEQWEIREVSVCAVEHEFLTPDLVYNRLSRRVNRIYTYRVQSGDTLSRIATRFDTSVQAISARNGLTTTNIFPGERLNIYTQMPLLTIRTVDHIASTEPIEMPVKTRNNPSLPQGQVYTIQAGQPGEQQGILEIIRENGIERERHMLEPVVLREPVLEIIYVGTGPAQAGVR